METDGKLVVNLTRGTIVCDQVVIADRAGRRMRGLLGRDSLGPGQGMLLQPAPSIHTLFMRFPIDAIFMDGTLRVNKVVEDLRPWRMASARHAWAVLEVASGETQRLGVEIGDQLGVVEVTDKLGAVVPNLEEGHQHRGAEAVEALDEPRAVSKSGSSPGAVVASPKPSVGATRVLLVGTDRRFRSVAATLLTRRGCAVSLGDGSDDLGELARREGANVVVLDSGGSLKTAADGAAKIEALNPPVGLVVVGEEDEHGLDSMPVIPKWGSFDVLHTAIENARATPGSIGGNGHRA